MRNFLIALMTVFSVSGAYATSLYPCTPTVELQPSILNCNNGDTYYRIEVKTLGSPATPQCQGPNRYEYKTAEVSVSNFEGRGYGKLEIYDSEFSYTLGSGDGKFISRRFGLNLKNCLSPVNGGGVSFGN